MTRREFTWTSAASSNKNWESSNRALLGMLGLQTEKRFVTINRIAGFATSNQKHVLNTSWTTKTTKVNGNDTRKYE